MLACLGESHHQEAGRVLATPPPSEPPQQGNLRGSDPRSREQSALRGELGSTLTRDGQGFLPP